MNGVNKKFLKQIGLENDSFVEFHEISYKGEQIVSPSARELADEIAAMANSADGEVILGIDKKTGKISGVPIEDIEEVIKWVDKVCVSQIIPPVFCHTKSLSVSVGSRYRKYVIKIKVPKSTEIHESPGGYFEWRTGSIIRLGPDRLARKFQQYSQVHLVSFDGLPILRAPFEALSKKLWDKFKTTLSSEDDKEFLVKNRLVIKNDKWEYTPSIAGLLLACENPQEFLPNSFIQAASYSGTEQSSDYRVMIQNFTGPLDKQIQETCSFVYKKMSYFNSQNPEETMISAYSMKAIFEAVVNSVAHRDYSVIGSKIRLHLFDDRIELYSPGNTPDTLSVHSLVERQFTRNENIANLLSRIPVDMAFVDTKRQYMMDRYGEGVPVILSESEKLSKRKPEYEIIDGSEIKLTIWAKQKD